MQIRITPLFPRRRKPAIPGITWKQHRGTIATAGTLLLLFLLSFVSHGSADTLTLNSGTQQVTLLELYTSQGCSSCPPAERWLNEYVDHKDLWAKIVPIAFHVDYWDYIGWKDIFATKANSERQREYARIGKSRTVYTPGLFNNGREWRGWTLRQQPRASARVPGNLSATITDNRLVAAFPAATVPLELHVALLGFGIDTKIERGENRNSTLRQEFVSLGHAAYRSEKGMWEVPLPAGGHAEADRYAIALWVNETGNPTPLQATGGWLASRSGE